MRFNDYFLAVAFFIDLNCFIELAAPERESCEVLHVICMKHEYERIGYYSFINIEFVTIYFYAHLCLIIFLINLLVADDRIELSKIRR